MERLFKLIKDNSTIFITLLTALGYMSAYEYEVGQCDYFDIPVNFIEIDLQELISFTSFAFLYLMLCAGLIYCIIQMNNLFTINALQKYITTFLGFLTLISISLKKLLIIPSSVQLCVCACFLLVAICIRLYNVKHLKISNIRLYNLEHNNKSVVISQKITFVPFAIVVFVLTILAIKEVGYLNSSTKSQFYNINYKSNLVLIKQYGQKLYCRDFDVKTHKFKDSLIVINIAQTEKIKISLLPITINPK